MVKVLLSLSVALALAACQHSATRRTSSDSEATATKGEFADCEVTYSWRLEKPVPKSAADNEVLIYNKNGFSAKIQLLDNNESFLVFKNQTDLPVTLTEFKLLYRFEGRELASNSQGFPDRYEVPAHSSGVLRKAFEDAVDLAEKKGSVSISFFAKRQKMKSTVVQETFQLHKYRTVSACKEERSPSATAFTRVD